MCKSVADTQFYLLLLSKLKCTYVSVKLKRKFAHFFIKEKIFFRMFSKAEKIKIFFLLGYNDGVTKAKKREKNRGTKRYVSMAVTVSTKNSTSTNNKCSFILCPPAYPSVFFLLPIPIIFFQFLYILFFPFFFFCC